MKNLTTFYSDLWEDNQNLYLYFKLGDNNYATHVKQVVEVMKLPLLDYPQKLPNNIIGLLKYNNFTINVLDLRFYLNIKVAPYSVLNKLLIVKTDESIFGLIIDKVEDIISLDQAKIEYLPTSEEKIIEFIYKYNNETISAINLSALENVLRKGIPQSEIDIPSLFPHDDDSQYELIQRNLFLQEKSNMNMITNIFSQDKFISFSLGESLYCINLEYIKEFLKNVAITPVPCNLDYIEGIIVLKGDFITIINTQKFLTNTSIEKKSPTNNEVKNNVIIIEISDYKIGFLVDEIFNIVNIPEEAIRVNPHHQDKYIQGEVIQENKLYNVLNIKTILSDEKFFIEEG